MDILTKGIIDNSINDGDQLNAIFNSIIKRLELNYERSNSYILKEVLQDYYGAISIIESRDILVDRGINIFVYIQLMAKIKSIGILKSSLDKNEFSEYKKLLVIEVKYDDKIVSKSLSYILSNNYIINSDKVALKYLNNFWANYLEILVNLHQYTDINIKTNIRIAESFKNDFINIITDSKAIESIGLINTWLINIVERSKIIKEGI